MTTRLTRRVGFTLMELIVAIAVAGVVVMVGYSALTTAIDSRARTAEAARVVAHAVGLRRTLTHWLDGAGPRIPRGVSDPSVLAQLQFVTRNPTPLHSALTTVTLYVDDGSSGYGRGLVALLHPSTGPDTLRVMLDTTVHAMGFWYAIDQGGVPMWVTEDQVGPLTPVAFRLQLQSTAPDVARELATPIVVPTRAGLR